MQREYVRVTFLPAGARRRRTVWAYVVKRTADRVVYREVSREGDAEFDGGTQNGLPVEQTRLIVAAPSEVRERPARMNLKYAMLEEVR